MLVGARVGFYQALRCFLLVCDARGQLPRRGPDPGVVELGLDANHVALLLVLSAEDIELRLAERTVGGFISIGFGWDISAVANSRLGIDRICSTGQLESFKGRGERIRATYRVVVSCWPLIQSDVVLQFARLLQDGRIRERA